MSKISRQSSTMTIQITTKTMFIELVELVVLVRKEPQLLFSQATVLNKQGNSSMSFVKQIKSSIPSLLRSQDIPAVGVIHVMDMVEDVVVVVEEVLNLFKSLD